MLPAIAVDDGVQIEARDTGEGIDAADLPYVFDRFWQGDKVRPHSDGAVGLGLTIARQLVRAQRGKIEVESKKGLGSIFTIYLPKDKISDNRV